MRKGFIVIAVLGAAACQKTGDNEYQVVRPGLVVDTLYTPEVASTTDTVRTPTVGTEKDTIIVNKPVFGTKETEIRRPTTKNP